MPVTIQDLDAWMAQRQPAQSQPQPQPQPSMGMGSPGTPSPSPSPSPSPAPAPPTPSMDFDTAFPNASAFVDGLLDTLTLGVVKTPKERDFFSGEGLAETAGMMVGEIPFWMIGGGIAKHLVSKGLKAGGTLAKAAQTSGAFGKTVKVAQKFAPEIGEAITAVGIDVGRATIGDDEDALSPLRLGINVSAPFAMAAVKIGRTRGEKKRAQIEEGKILDRMAQARETFMENVGSGRRLPNTMVKDLTDGERMFKQRQLNAVFKGLREDDQQHAMELAKVFRLTVGGLEQEERLMALARRGAPLDDLAHLHTADDITDYIKHKSKYPINRPAIRDWKERTDQDLFIIRQSVWVNTRKGGQEVIPEIPVDDVATASKHWRNQVPPEVQELGDIGLPENFRPISGGSGIGLTPDEMMDKLMEVPIIQPPQTRVDEVIRNFVDRTAGWAGVNKAVISAVRVVEGLGDNGRQLAGLLRNVRFEAHARFGQAQADLLNAFSQMKTVDQYVSFVRALNDGDAPMDEAVGAAVKAFRDHQEKYIEKQLIKQGTKVMMADGTTKPLGETLQSHFFPHVHDWDAIMKDQKMQQMMLDQLNEKYPGRFTNLTAPQVLKMYTDKARRLQMPRFSSLFERDVNMPGWLGDPATAAMRGETNYKADVQDAVMGFLEDAYTMVSANKHLGAPKGYDLTDVDLMTNLRPIHNAVKGLMDANAPGTGQFFDPNALERAAKRGDAGAQEIINSVKASFIDGYKVENAPWKVKALLEGMAQEGYDPQKAFDLVQNVLGARYYLREEQRFSKALRDYNIITKLPLLVVDNIGQISFTSTKAGFMNAARGLVDIVKDWQGSQEFARIGGVLVEDALRGLEADAGRSFAGTVLKKTGFRATESFLRTHAAVTGKHYVGGLLDRLGKNAGDEVAIRHLRKIGFNTDLFVKDGQLTEFGRQSVNAIQLKGDQELAKVIHRMAGFEMSRQTQFLADVMDMPFVAATPWGKVFLQFKSFVLNTTKFILRDVMDEAQNGVQHLARSAAHVAKGEGAMAAEQIEAAARSFLPLVRFVMVGATLGEVTQNARAMVSGQDPSQRGQVGWVRDLFGDNIPREKTAAINYLGRKWSTDDIAARLVENMIGLGMGGAFVSMLESAMVGGKLRMLEMFAGPSVSSGLDLGGAVVGAFQGKPEQLARRILREAPGALGAMTPIPGAAVVGAAAGRIAQTALVPTEGQLERSGYLSAEDYRRLAMKDIERRYTGTRKMALEAVRQGKTGEAIQIINTWNSGVGEELQRLQEVGALTRGSFQSIVFGRREIQRVMAGQDDEPSAFTQAAERLGDRLGPPRM